MTHLIDGPADASGFELRFPALAVVGPSLAFPCDADGAVALDALSERARNNYFLARTLVGRNYGSPRVLRCLNRQGHIE